MTVYRWLALGLATACLGSVATAEVVSAEPDRYVLRHEAVSPLAPDALWDRLIDPASWWHPDHTYSGDAANLRLDAQAGGQWREEWDGGSVLHGAVLQIRDGETLVLDAPFGPLQSMGVTVIWTITLEPAEEGTAIRFDEVAVGASGSGLDAVAPAVDGVKAEAIARLAANPG
ncbi:MAG: SRPBCC domain-containing protein [Pseudomonadota bacterium]